MPEREPRPLGSSGACGDRKAGHVQPSLGPHARCGRGFALMYASRRHGGCPRGAPRRQGTGPCSSTRQIGLERRGDRQERGTTDQSAHASTTFRRTARRAGPMAACEKTNWTSCQRWKRTGTSPSHPSASPLNRIVLSNELQLGRRSTKYRPKDSSCCASVAAVTVPAPSAASGAPSDISQVADCGRLRGASIHRAK